MLKYRRFFTNSTNLLYRRQKSNLIYIRDVITREEEELICSFLEPILKRRRYEKGHWDSVISKYKEVELISTQTPTQIRNILNRLSEQIISYYDHKPSLQMLLPPHVIDLDANGFIAPHVDNIRHSGEILAGLSLLSKRVMRLSKETEIKGNVIPTAENRIEQILDERSLYILKGPLRYDYAHSILGSQDNLSSVTPFPMERRISIIFRDATPP